MKSMKSEVDGGDIGEIGLLMGEVFHQFQKLDSWTRKMLITSLSWTRWRWTGLGVGRVGRTSRPLFLLL